jgi:hypothetical protein
MSKINDISLDFRDKHLNRQLQYNRKYREIFNKVAAQFAALSSDPNAKFTRSFKFNGVINNKIDIIIESFQKEALNLTELEIEKTWSLSNDKNDTIVKDYIKTIGGIKAAQEAKWFMPNIPALKAFINTKHDTGTLSDAVWRVAEQVRDEMRIHLGIGLANGDSADVISRRIRQYLQNPEALFRRIRDKNGRLVASQAMIDNAPGQGVYNSAFKNAMRVARTNTNMSYLYSDNLRWNEIDMVIGVSIKVSAQHHIIDICDSCEGTYPKDFKFIGWHSQCMCHAVPIMSSKENFRDYLDGKADLDTTQITDYSDEFKNYVKDNYERYSNYKSVPCWIQDNKKIIKDILKN